MLTFSNLFNIINEFRINNEGIELQAKNWIVYVYCTTVSKSWFTISISINYVQWKMKRFKRRQSTKISKMIRAHVLYKLSRLLHA